MPPKASKEDKKEESASVGTRVKKILERAKRGTRATTLEATS